MIRRIYILIMTIVGVMSVSCERLPLYDEASNITLEINIDLELEMEGTQPAPTTMVAAFFHPDSHDLIYDQYTGPTGGELFIDPGDYHLLCYNFDSGATHVRQEGTYHLVEAYTNLVRPDERYVFDAMKRSLIEMGRGNRSYMDEPMIYEPDHLYVANLEEANIPVRYEGEHKFVIHAGASTMVETWSVEVGEIIKPEWVQTAIVYITGQAQSKQLASNTHTGVPSTLYFTLYESASRTNPDENVFQSTFRTFGRYHADDNRVYLILDILSTSGKHTMWEWDVSDQMQGSDHHIIVRDKIEVPSPTTSGNGFLPTVYPWEDNVTNIEI